MHEKIWMIRPDGASVGPIQMQDRTRPVLMVIDENGKTSIVASFINDEMVHVWNQFIQGIEKREADM
jgi:hypothetical protein